MLRLEHISWNTPEGTKVLDDLSLTAPDGKLTVITGPNGGGKTTLAKIIAGIEKPASGRVYLDDTDITDLDVTQRARLGVSYAFQQPVRFKGITVRQLVELASGNTLDEAALCAVLSRVGLCAREYIDREVNSTLSGGNAGVDLISRSVARGKSHQEYRSAIVGDAPCTGHSECDAIIAEEARVDAAPELKAHHPDASLIHEAAIGKIAGEQILKLRTLGLTEAEAEAKIIEGFLN